MIQRKLGHVNIDVGHCKFLKYVVAKWEHVIGKCSHTISNPHFAESIIALRPLWICFWVGSPPNLLLHWVPLIFTWNAQKWSLDIGFSSLNAVVGLMMVLWWQCLTWILFFKLKTFWLECSSARFMLDRCISLGSRSKVSPEWVSNNQQNKSVVSIHFSESGWKRLSPFLSQFLDLVYAKDILDYLPHIPISKTHNLIK